MAEAADEEVLVSEDVMNELLLHDDLQYVRSWGVRFYHVTRIPAGSQVEGGFLARNVRDHKEWEDERDRMHVIACIRSPNDGVLVEVGEMHVHVRCPHTGIYIVPQWEQRVRESCTSPPAGDTLTHSYINGRKLLQGYSASYQHVQGPSAALTYSPDGQLSAKVRELDRRIIEWSETLTRYGCTLPVTTCLTQLYQCARDMREWLTDNGLTHRRYRVRMVSQELLDSLSSVIGTESSCDQLQEGVGQVCQLLTSHLVRGVEIMKMCHSHDTDLTVSEDNVPAIECLFWPHQAEAWINRPRLWPPQEVIEQVVRQGFHLVSKLRHINPSECDFRISFALSEQIIARARCDGHKRAYYIMKMLYYRFLKCIGPSDDDTLKSYACKTVMLWVCEQHAVTWWEENSTLTTVTCLLKYLLECLVKRRMDYFFIPDVNLFDGWNTPPAVLEECAAKISDLLHGNRLHETLCGVNLDILAHRLLVKDIGYKSLDVEDLVSRYGKMKMSIVELLSVYCDVAQSVMLPSALDHTDITALHQLVATTTRAAYCLPATMNARRVSQFVGRIWGQAHTSLYDKVRSGGASEGRSYREMLRDAWATDGGDSLLGDLHWFMYHIDAVCKYVGEYVSTVRDMCHYTRQVVHVLCAPQVLLDARHLWYDDDEGERYKSLDDNQVITHFISVIQGATHAAWICDQYLDECIRKLT